MQRCLYIFLLMLMLPNGFAFIFNHDNNDESQTRLFHHRHSSGGILGTHKNSSGGVINPTTKTAAKVVACETIGKGICLGVAGIKYAESKLIESKNTDSPTQRP